MKTPTTWTTNPAALANTDTYDGTGIYDTSGTFDAIVSGQSFITTKVANTWSITSKNATTWQANPVALLTQPYDSASVQYDSGTRKYDALVAGKSALTNKVATTWSTT